MVSSSAIGARIAAIEYFLPSGTLTTSALASEFPEWSMEKIESKTGIRERHVAGPNECSSDLAVEAARKLFASGACSASEIDYVLFCTQSPDYFLPTTACLIQARLGIRDTAGALDFNLGCSGFVAGLGLAKGLIETGQARRLLLLTGETYSKFIHPRDKSVRTIFGDAGAATLVVGEPLQGTASSLGPFVYGTDGSGAENLIVPTGGMRESRSDTTSNPIEDDSGNMRSRDNLFMNGAEVFNFTLRRIPECVDQLLTQAGLSLDQVDRFVFHQANQYMLEHLRKKLKVPAEKFVVAMSHCGNTVSSTIPIALREASADGRIQPGEHVMLVGFGVGYSWAGTLVRWSGLAA
ncbi:3-oxoacyl-ACP synthase [Bryobacterales bacterium F-183]|nr:3-oxoacyl-ACP synthase [Bryobacterales bacterium F-183]